MATAVNALNILLGVKTATITSPYGTRTLNGVTGFHSGIDLTPVSFLACPTRGKVVAVVDGILESQTPDIIKNKRSSLYNGNSVTLRHGDGYETYYCHLASNSIKVKIGQILEPGFIFGKAGSTGYTTGAHLHFGVKKDGKWVDPLPFFIGQGLLPLEKPEVSRPELPKLTVLVDSLRYRNDPDGEILGYLVKNAKYPYLGLTETINGYKWAEILVDGNIAYTASNPLWNEIALPYQNALEVPIMMVGIIKGKTYTIKLEEQGL
jgi:murein DD-endopeptidase MepM/ murein hydrolase activator NlpD